MPLTFRHHAPLRVPLVRAATTFVLLNLVLRVIGALVHADFINAAGIVCIMTLLGPLDVRRRGELVLWGNLGYRQWVFAFISGGFALIAELLLAGIAAMRE